MSVGEIKQVVVRGTNWVGDSFMTVPALRALRRLLPEAKITLAIRPSAKGIFSEVDFIDDVLVYDRRNAFSVVSQVREWRRRRVDLAVLFQNAFEAALIPFLAGVPVRIGYATESRKHEAAELLRSYGVSDRQSVVAICPGSINSRAKRWPAESYAALADRLLEEQRQVVLIGSRDEIDVTNEVTKRMLHAPVVLTGKTTLDQITAVLGMVDLVVTNDTGPAHIAAALGCPTIVIFGPTNPLTTRPFSFKAEILRHPPDCAPCMLRDCPIDHRCMTAITVDEVFEHSQALLKRASFEKTVRSVCDSVA